ncbi:hypothetical protein D9756_011435 [Leucocoprinus leucothites]|uniref:Uncharacterized protein n=1 Tax=Leucocoprinus leucothites TaxID=201217 RepID=A0A8H5CLI9_9AGAR|nr:hypothetical protein D9756_011435 [Leucoagaricus leucothites]
MPRAYQKPAEPDSIRRSTALVRNSHPQITSSGPDRNNPGVFSRFNDLPRELQRDIFEIAYQLSPEYPANWVHISQQIKEWIEPLVYDDCRFFMSRHWRLERYKRTYDSKPKEFYAKNVRRIFIDENLRDNDCIELKLLRICDNLTSLECWARLPLKDLVDILTTKKWSNLKVLCLNIDLIPRDETTFHLALFQHVTHLDIKSQDQQLPSWESLQSLENLTHMRVNMPDKEEFDFDELVARRIVDKVYDIANEARKHFPVNLKYFIILVPFGRLYCVLTRGRSETEVDQWDRLAELGFGKFDQRILLSSCDDWETWQEASPVEVFNLEQAFTLLEYPNLEFPTWPRVHVDVNDTWEAFV